VDKEADKEVEHKKELQGGRPDDTSRCIIIGAGPAGLTAAWELAALNIPALLFEQDVIVGGIAQTADYKGFRFDIGGHRFFTKVETVQRVWEEILKDDFLLRPRLSRIHYQGMFFDYPLKPLNALRGLGVLESIRVGFSYLKAQLFPYREEKNLEEWVSNRFGRRLYEIFFKTYTEKVWGMKCTEIGADWAAQRIKNLNLVTAVKNALLGARGSGQVVTSLIEQFHYPRLGPGMMWERCRELLEERGYPTYMRTRVIRIKHDKSVIRSVVVRDEEGREREECGTHFISSMPIRGLIRCMEPSPPPEVIDAANRLRYRDFLTVVLIIEAEHLFDDNWIYIHSPEVRLGRVQNFKNWSPEMVPDPRYTSLGLEYFVQEGDELWSAADEDLIELGRKECAHLGLIDPDKVVDGTVLRMPKAYPIYDEGYRDALAVIRRYVDAFPNLYLVGRNGQHRYNNQDHSMLTAIYAARNIAGANYSLWDVNVEESYHEEVDDARGRGDPLVPTKVPEETLDIEKIREAFALYDPVALGGAVGVVGGVLLFMATAILLIKGGRVVGPTLSLLGYYFPGYRVTWGGAFLGLFEGLVLGFAFGYILAWLINVVVRLHLRAFISRVELSDVLDPLRGDGP